MSLSILLVVVVIALFMFGVLQFWIAASESARLERAVLSKGKVGTALKSLGKFDQFVLSTRWGPQAEAAAAISGLPLAPGNFVAVGAGMCVLLAVILGSTLSWLLAPLGLFIGFIGIRGYIRRQRNQRREAFIAQMPELARSLSNASSAGLSVRTAIAVAAAELDEPASAELHVVTAELNLGGALNTSLTSMEQRLPSREVAILVSSLVVSARSGGGLVTALRDIAGTLETRKELRREIRTTYAQTVSTAYAVMAMGVLSLFMLEQVQPGTVDAMLRSFIGQLALAVSAGFYLVGFVLVRRMTRIDI